MHTKDVRLGTTLYPMGLLIWEQMTKQEGFAIKEIAIVVPEEELNGTPGTYLKITHNYLFIYIYR